MSDLPGFKDKVQAISTRYSEISKIGHRAQGLSFLLEARILLILKVGNSLIEASQADLPPLLPKILDLYEKAKETAPTTTELSSPDYPISDDIVMAKAQYIEEAIDPAPDHHPARAEQLVQSALEKLLLAFDELGQARDILIHSGIRIGVAGSQAELIVNRLNNYNNSL